MAQAEATNTSMIGTILIDGTVLVASSIKELTSMIQATRES